MQTKVFLQSFDKNILNTNHQINLEEKIAQIKAEQEKIFQKKLADAEQKIRQDITKELEKKYQDDLNNVRQEISKKHIIEIQDLKKKITEDYDVYTLNCIKFMEFFLNYYLIKLNKSMITNEIKNEIYRLSKENQKQSIKILCNQNNLEYIKEHINLDNINIEFICDESISDNNMRILYESGGIHFSSDNLIKFMNDTMIDLFNIS